MRIHKQTLVLNEEQRIWLPEGAKILSVQAQRGQIAMWYLNDGAPSRLYTVVIVGTGHNVPAGALQYVGTVQMNDGTLVWHIFLKE